MKNTIQNMKVILQSNDASDDDDANIAISEAKLTKILQKASLNDDNKDSIDAIKAFLSASDIQRRKVLSYCLDFFDPTIAKQQVGINGEQIQQHRFLQEDELIKLYKFVARHSADKTFGDIVYKVMEAHEMTAPEVYKKAQMRRQDFARVTDRRCKSVTRQLAWQIIIGLQCSLKEADEVLFSAGFIRKNSQLDLTMEYFIQQENYDIMAINEVLDGLGMKAFSCYKSVRDKDNK